MVHVTLHLTVKMTTTQLAETSVTNNSLSKHYPHPDDHAKQNENFMLPMSCFRLTVYSTLGKGKP